MAALLKVDGLHAGYGRGQSTAWARSAHRPQGAQARSLRSGRAYAGQSARRYAKELLR